MDRHVPGTNLPLELIMVGTIPILYKNKPIRQTTFEQKFSSSPSPETNGLPQKQKIEHGNNSAMGMGISSKQQFSKFASDIISHEEQSSQLLGRIPYTKRKPQLDLRPGQGTENAASIWRIKNVSSSQLESITISEPANLWNEFSLPTEFGKKRKPSHVKKPNFGPSYSTNASANSNSDCSKDLLKIESFDICLSKSEESATVLEKSLHTRNYGSWNEVKRKVNSESHKILRPGIVLLKHYIPHHEQVHFSTLFLNQMRLHSV